MYILLHAGWANPTRLAPPPPLYPSLIRVYSLTCRVGQVASLGKRSMESDSIKAQTRAPPRSRGTSLGLQCKPASGSWLHQVLKHARFIMQTAPSPFPPLLIRVYSLTCRVGQSNTPRPPSPPPSLANTCLFSYIQDGPIQHASLPIPPSIPR